MKELNNNLTSARNFGNVGLILDKEEELAILMDQVCRQEAEKMAVFRLVNDEKPTRAMISLEKKLVVIVTSIKLINLTQTTSPWTKVVLLVRLRIQKCSSCPTLNTSEST